MFYSFRLILCRRSCRVKRAERRNVLAVTIYCRDIEFLSCWGRNMRLRGKLKRCVSRKMFRRIPGARSSKAAQMGGRVEGDALGDDGPRSMPSTRTECATGGGLRHKATMSSLTDAAPDISGLSEEQRQWVLSSCPSELGPSLFKSCVLREASALNRDGSTQRPESTPPRATPPSAVERSAVSRGRSSYEIEVARDDELFVINGEKFEAKTQPKVTAVE